MRIVGLDVSTHTGFVVLESEYQLPKATARLESGALKGLPPMVRMRRLMTFKALVKSYLTTQQPQLAVVEGYSHASRFSFAVLAELGTVVRMACWEAGVPFVEVSPSSLKKFVTGKGAAKKGAMIKAVRERWRYKTEDDNLADAYGLAQIGLRIMGVVPLRDAYERSLVGFLPRPRAANCTGS